MAHLNAVIRFYRSVLPPVQKVGEPSDLLYREQTLANADQVTQYAFQSGRATAVLLQAYAKQLGNAGDVPAEGEAQRLQSYRGTLAARIQQIKDQQKALAVQLQHAKRGQVAAIEQQQERLDGALDLNMAIAEALARTVVIADAAGRAGLAGDIERLQRTVPELATDKSKPVATAPIENLSSAASSGVTSQATVIFQLLGTRRAIDGWVRELDTLHSDAVTLRAPLIDTLRALVHKSEAYTAETQASMAATAQPSKPEDARTLKQQILAERQTSDSVTATFKTLSAASVPLSQEIITLEQTRANLLAWRAAVDAEYDSVLRSLLLRVFFIALALGVVAVLGEAWRRGTVRYVHDLRRRRQLLVLRRIVVGFISALVVAFGLVTQFNSLATFAGFITAGLAVGLQTILLSVAAYFFIVGRYGVRVGDRITVAGVTGDVVDVGLVRLYIMELGGSGNELHATGRIAVFPNSVLFQATTPLYKQMPGTEYAWRELTVKLSPNAPYQAASKALLRAVRTVYEPYRARIESQHRALESWMDAAIDSPEVESRLQLVEGGLQLWVRFPVEMQQSATTEEQVAASLVRLMNEDAEVKAAVMAPPQIKAVTKG